jgi:hypothetical protein
VEAAANPSTVLVVYHAAKTAIGFALAVVIASLSASALAKAVLTASEVALLASEATLIAPAAPGTCPAVIGLSLFSLRLTYRKKH